MLRHPVESAPYQMRRQKKLILINLFSLDSLLNSQCSITILLRTYLRHPFWEGSNLVRKCGENNHYWDVVGGLMYTFYWSSFLTKISLEISLSEQRQY